MKCGFGIGYGICRNYQPIWVLVSVSDQNQNSGFGRTLQLAQKKVLNGIYYKAVTIPGGKPFAIVAITVQLFLKATLTTKIMIQAILLPLARTTTFLEFITWPSEIWQGKKTCI